MPVTNFESYTEVLNDNEKYVAEVIRRSLMAKHVGKENAITNKVMREKLELYLNDKGRYFAIADPKMRQIIHYIRVNSNLIICGTEKGYFIAKDQEEAESYIKSLTERRNSIQEILTDCSKKLSAWKGENQTNLWPQQ